ncbi:zinc finger protein 292b isoform X2 [Esox lucius]|uniref:zinc finger protein 292b isoform X2 n=1 Tax=Esox lucius TaxID=8010 RepID=UPI0014768BA0|nr:zinc finger protein 292b isoform X2 [Esox lucius]
MADEEAEQDLSAQTDTSATIAALREKLQVLSITLRNSTDSPAQSSSRYCQDFCQTLVEYADRWRIEEEPLPLVEVYKVALLSYAQASPCLSSKCENVPLVLERLSLSCVELLLSLPEHFSDALWGEFKSSVQLAHSRLQENGIGQLSLLSAVTQETGVWSNDTLRDVLSDRSPQTEKVHRFLELEGPVLLEMRVKHLIKENHMERAARLAKACAEYPHFEGKGHFRQMYLVCLCAVSAQEPLIEELSKVDCRDALEMICNLESEGNDRGALSVCSAFLTRQLLQGDSYCAWELTLFWSKLLKRLELSEEMFLDRCCQMSLLSKTVFHILFLIKVIQSEVDTVGLPVCIEMCIRALQLESSDGNNKATICKTISCLLPADLEIKRASQLTEFLLDPTVDSYYAVETLYNEPDQKLEEENLPIPNSLRCELLLVFKTQWPFDPEFWDWKTLKRHCLALMGEEASIVSSIDLLNDSESPEAPEEEEEEDTAHVEDGFRDVSECFIDTTQELNEITDRRQKNRETKKLREKGFISARFRNWQAYMQYCVLCDKEFLGHRIVRHAQTHYKDGFYSCPICAETFTTKDILEPHVASHVKLSCKERLAAIKTNKKLANPKTAAPVIAALKAKTENELWSKDSNSDYQVHNGEFLQTETVQTKFIGLKSESTEENTCPVANCKKGFKYFRNLLVHVKAHGDNDEARRFLEMQSKKVICQYCRRQFVSVTHLNDHLQVHCGVRPYICIQLNCKASFLSNTELLVHRKGHVIFKAKCMFPGCGKIFSEAYKLYDHEAQHYKTFTCKVPECGTVFHSQAQLDLHREEHVTIKDSDSDLCYSRDQRMLSDQAFVSEEVDETSQLSTSIAVKHSIQNLLNASEFPIQNNQEYMIKSDPPDKEMYPFSESSVIRSTTNAQTHNPNKQTHRPLDLSETAEYDFVIPTPQQHNPLSSYQDTGDLGHAMRPNVFQGPVQSVRNDVNYGSTNYNSDYRAAVPVQPPHHQQQQMSANVSSADQTSHYMSTQTLPSSSHTLLPLVTRLPAKTQCPLPSTPGPQQCPLPSTPGPQQCALPSTPGPQQCALPSTPGPQQCALPSTPGPQQCALPITPGPQQCTLPSTKAPQQCALPSAKAPQQCALPSAKAPQQCALPSAKAPQQCALPSANAPQQCALPSANAPQQCALPSTKASQQCTLPSTKAPQQCPLPSTPAQPQGEKERHHCALETCDRNYSSYRSVTKHMKAAHPDFYTEWKIANRKNREQEKAERARKPVLSSVPEIGNSTAVAPLRSQPSNDEPVAVNRQNVIQPPLYSNPNHSYPSHSPGLQGQAFPNQMDNILDPIVLSQLGNNSNQYRAPSMPWQQPPENNQIHNSYSPQVYSSDVQGMPLMDTVGGGMDVHVIPSDRMLGSNVQRPIESILPPQRDNHLQPVFPSYMDILKDSSLSNQMENVTPSYTPQIENDPCSKLNPSKKSKGMQKTTKMESNFAPAANLPPKTNRESQDGKVNSGNPENPTIKKVKRNKRTKWPAILKDGKFICSRCGRAFSNPKSLGGHLSKRSHCKAYDETELLTADLPSSFLDLLNSEQLLNTPPTQSLLYNPVTPYANEGKQTDDILKQIMDTPNISNLFESTATPQPLFQNPCGPYGPGGRLPESTVIHHTADIQVKTESESYRESYLQPTMDPGFGNSAFSDPLLSQMLVENNPTVSLHRLPTDHIDHLLRAETLMKMKEVKGSSSESDSGGLSNDGLLAAMASLAQNLMANPMLQVTSPDPQPQHSPAATSSKPLETQRNRTEQNIKKRLREQILAGDFQRRSSLSRASSTDTFASLNPVSSNIATNVMQHFEVNQCSQPSNTIDNIMPVLSAQVNGEAQMQSSTSTQSFTHFREASSQHQEIPAPIDIVANDVDSGPTSIPANQQHWIMDIQTALERLDLDKQVCDFTPTLSSPKPSCTDICKETEVLRPNVSNDKDSYVPDGCRKPFICENDNCNYSAMTKDAILKHLVRAHSYTSEMICLLKKNHGKFAPFSCKMCDKTFTRNSNLRAHCQTAHRMTQQEIAKLKINRQSSNTVGFDISDSKQPLHSGPPLSCQMGAAPHSVTEKITHRHSLPDVNQNRNETGNNFFVSGEGVKQEHPLQPFEKKTSQGMADRRFHDNSLSVGMQPMKNIPIRDQPLTPLIPGSEYQMNAHCSAIPQQTLVAAPDASQWSSVPCTPVHSRPMSTHYSQQSGGYLAERSASVTSTAADPLAAHTTSLDKTPKIKQPRGPKPKVEIQRKVKDKKTEASGAFSPYRPYRCVHHGCTAAFTIQHNLILHYRAVHQSALSTFEVNNENDQNEEQESKKDIKLEGVMEEPEGEIIPVMEFRCQVKDCSRVFQDVPNLLQHYLQLHKFSVDKAGSLLSNINLGRFRCDQQGCTASFTAFWKYIGHIEKEHDKAKLTKMEPVDGMFQCDVEGCDRAYATKSNLLRHTMKKHHELYKLQLMNQPKGEDGGKPVSKNSHYQMTKSSDGKENIESNKKFTPKGGDKRKMTESTGKNHWTKYGKPSLKSKDEASAMCIKKSSLQYPCMIKGCDSVMKSERSIMKHYMGHGLSERYLEEQRSHFIFCKKYPRRRNPHAARSDDSKSESSSEISESEGTADTGLEGSEFDEYSKPVLRRRGKSELSNGKPSYDESSETVSDGSVTGKRKRGRPQKTGFEKIVKRKRMSRLTRSNAGDCGEHRSDYDSSSNTLTQDEINDQSETLTSFKPMGFEMSFLKFLEQSNTSKNSLKKIKLRNATVLCKRSDAHLHYPKGFDTLEFRNPQKLTSLTNVKIVVDKAFSGVADTLLKQLQEMRPTVILKK